MKVVIVESQTFQCEVCDFRHEKSVQVVRHEWLRHKPERFHFYFFREVGDAEHALAILNAHEEKNGRGPNYYYIKEKGAPDGWTALKLSTPLSLYLTPLSLYLTMLIPSDTVTSERKKHK